MSTSDDARQASSPGSGTATAWPGRGTSGDGRGTGDSRGATTAPSAGPEESPKVRPAAPRRVRLTIARMDPWSVMKLSFLLSVALGIALVVASGVLWSILDGMGVYTDVSRVVGEIIGDPSFDLTTWVGFGRTLSLVTVIAVANVVLMTAISTLGALLYNISSALVGGLHVTLSDD